MESQLEERLALEQEIREGIESGQFIPYYQPQIGLPSGDLSGFEVLARWQSPKRGLVEPSGFIEVAEASGLIAPLSLRVMRDALSEAAAWPDHLQVAVNISPVQFRDPLLAERIQAVLVETSFPPHRLELEVTESSIFEDQQQALETVHKIKGLGIRLSLDDFGTGYASLTQLRALPFDRIKIDKSFVANLLTDQQSSAIVSTITSLGRALDLPITAEGVECRQVHEMIEALGCSSAQGWLFGRAMAGSDVQAMLSIAPIESHDIPPSLDYPEVKERRDRQRRSSPGAKAAA
jgi:EAL domain-containing protein (putative c-di-GMP-specific phosphodiesterase class I)